MATFKGLYEHIREGSTIEPTYQPITLKVLNDCIKKAEKDYKKERLKPYEERITAAYLLSLPDWMFIEYCKYEKQGNYNPIVIGGTDQFKAIEERKIKLGIDGK